MNKNKSYFDDISCIRAILVIGIVLGHAFAIYTGGPAWPLPENIASISFYKYINPAVISFHLQVFVFIAGFLFSSQMSENVPPVRKFIVKTGILLTFVPNCIIVPMNGARFRSNHSIHS